MVLQLEEEVVAGEWRGRGRVEQSVYQEPQQDAVYNTCVKSVFHVLLHINSSMSTRFQVAELSKGRSDSLQIYAHICPM